MLLNGWTRWDAGWYAHIAENGYSDQPLNDQGQRNVVFFPLYPMCVRALNLVTHNSDLSGIILLTLLYTNVLLLALFTIMYTHTYWVS